jgi:sulfopyruvate decarboxylase subunit alpha
MAAGRQAGSYAELRGTQIVSSKLHRVQKDARPANWAAGVCAGLHAAGSRDVVYVPDNPLSHVLRILHDEYSDVTTTIATREEEAFGIAAGLYLGSKRPTVMLQSSGLGNSLNALASLLIPYQIPVLVLVSMRGDAGEWNGAQVPMGRAVAPICQALGLPLAVAETPETTAETVRLVGLTAFSTRLPGVCQLPRQLTVPAFAPALRRGKPRA